MWYKGDFWLRASYTVEGALVFSICILLLLYGIIFAFDLFHESISFVTEHPVEASENPADSFRKAAAWEGALSDLADAVQGDE